MKRPSTGCSTTRSRISRMSSMPRWEAASISTTSSEVPFAIATQTWQLLSGVECRPAACPRSSGPWRESVPSTSCPCRAARRRDTPGAPGRARSRSAAFGRRPPARRPRRSPADGTSGRARSPGGFKQVRASTRRSPATRSVFETGILGGILRRRLGSGGTAAPERESLALLPSGPDAVRTLPVRGTRSVNTACEDPIPKTPPLGRRSAPHGADFGFREPLTPHLARPGSAEGSRVCSSRRPRFALAPFEG